MPDIAIVKVYVPAIVSNVASVGSYIAGVVVSTILVQLASVMQYIAAILDDVTPVAIDVPRILPDIS